MGKESPHASGAETACGINSEPFLFVPKVSPVPYLKTDPPIDFTPTFKDIEGGGVEIKSGFLTLTIAAGRIKFAVFGF